MTDSAPTLELQSCLKCGRINAFDVRYCPNCGTEAPKDDQKVVVEVRTNVQADPLIGNVIAERYKILSLIGRGGMGVVYKAEHVRIGKLLAIKLLAGELARDKDTVKRFKREAEMASKLSHPNTVQIFDFGRADNLMYLVMEYVSGRDFAWIIQHEGPLAFARAARIGAQVCASLSEAHSYGVIHRDLKPENVMVAETRSQPDFVKVLDFGLAKLRDQDGGITRAGSIVGTPYYMAPEHIRGDRVDGRTDIYSIGAMLYKACTGVPPFTSTSAMGVLTKHLSEELVLPSKKNPELPPQCDDIIGKAMAKDPKARYQSAEEMRDDLVAYLASVGEDTGMTLSGPRTTRAPSSKSPAKAEVVSLSGKREILEVATRGEIDSYEKRIRRLSYIGYVFLAVLFVAASASGIYYWRTSKEPPPTVEIEPNNEPAQATELVRGISLTGHIGARQSPTFSDADVFVLRNPGGERRNFKFTLTGLPNMDLVVDVVRAGFETPVLSVDSGGVGAAEAVPNFFMEGLTYYLRVREFWHQGQLPTENVSDTYRISWDYVTQGEGEERESNDSLELGNPLALNAHVHGYIGWGHDQDVFCLDQNGSNVQAVVAPVPNVDFVLSVARRGDEAVTTVDGNGPGAGEESAVLATADANLTCFVLSVSEARGGVRAEAEHRYDFTIRGAPH
ncbi:MAG: protein kinase [Sandaracinaceae bacterium]|nr:protein kinase [Sandaracinaceae bacterium]